MQYVTQEQLEKVLHGHEEAEFRCDLDGTMDTVCANPVYEFPGLGLRVEGRDAVRETYRRLLPFPEKLNVAADMRLHAVAPNQLCREAYISWDTDDGGRETGQYMAILSVDEEGKIAGERMYSDAIYTEALKRLLGEDFKDLPGVVPLGKK